MRKRYVLLLLLAGNCLLFPNSGGLATRVNRVREIVQCNVKDFNQDGYVNCIDYSTLFYVEWSKLYGRKSCMIVLNKNPSTGMNHLFVCCMVDNKWYCVEPWKTNEWFLMRDVWGSKYDPDYNVYNVTERWLWECGFVY